MNGSQYSQSEVVGMYVKVLERFKAANSDFIGAKFIFAPVRHVSNATFDSYVQTLYQLIEKYPDFVVGFDLVGQEDAGYTLFDFVREILKIRPNISFYFHAGETDWNGLTSENLVRL